MSIILICRKILNGQIKPKVSNIINGLKIHTISCPKVAILKKNSATIITKRTFLRFLKKPKKAELKIIDDIPDHYELIHRNTMERYILYTQLGTTISAIIVVFALFFSYGMPKNELHFYGGQEHKPRSTENEFEMYLGAYIFAVVLLQVLITKMPLRIYYASPLKKYIMILPSNLPYSSERLTCKVGDLEKLPLTGILPWKDARFRIKDQRDVILIEEHFRKPADLWVMMGVQRDPNSDDK